MTRNYKSKQSDSYTPPDIAKISCLMEEFSHGRISRRVLSVGVFDNKQINALHLRYPFLERIIQRLGNWKIDESVTYGRLPTYQIRFMLDNVLISVHDGVISFLEEQNTNHHN